LIKNGKKSSRGKTCHINIRYFFIVDVIKREGLTVRMCRSERMVTDYYTQPLQGKLFRKTRRDKIMGLVPMLAEERVENNKDDVTGKINTAKTESKKVIVKRSYADTVKSKS